MFQKISQLISPDCCVKCNMEGSLLCPGCSEQSLVTKKPACFYCNRLSETGQTCERCRRKTYLDGVLVTYRLQDPIDELIYRLKYYGNRTAAEVFTPALANLLSSHDYDLLSFVPTDGRAQRRRGYNQAYLLSRLVAEYKGDNVAKTMVRVSHTGQVGLGRQARFASVRDNFMVINKSVKGARIVLVDDVLTTGATLNECARVLKQAGAKNVWGLAAAKR